MEKNVTLLQPEAQQVATQAPLDMLQYAISQNAGIETLERLMAMQERANAAVAKSAFDRAISEAKAEIPVILKTQIVAYDKISYQYEDLGQIAKVIDPILSKHGLSYRFRTLSAQDKSITVTCVVSHNLGYSEENSLTAAPDGSGSKNSIQAIGSTQTYLQRYTLKAALGLAAARDDDARFIEPAETISESQVFQLQSLIEQKGADIAKFCKFANVSALIEIKAKNYPSLEKELLKKADKAGQNGAA